MPRLLFGFDIVVLDIYLFVILGNYNRIFFSVISGSDFHCDVCEVTKSHRISYFASMNKSTILFMKVHSDVWGPAKVSSFSGAR